MLKAYDINLKEFVIGKYAARGNRFTCPGCKEFVILRRGGIKIAHFSHKSDSNCGYGVGESQEHINAKQIFYDYFKENNIEVDLEVNLGKLDYKNYRVADIIIKDKYIVEIQKSKISTEDYKLRTSAYKNRGYKVIWIGLMKDISAYYRQNYGAANKYNGGYDVFLFENNIEINGLNKRTDDTTLFNKDILTAEDLIEFLYNKSSFQRKEDYQLYNIKETIEIKQKELDVLEEKELLLLPKYHSLEKDYNIKYNELEKDYKEYKERVKQQCNILKNNYQDNINILKNKLQKFKEAEEKERKKIERIENINRELADVLKERKEIFNTLANYKSELSIIENKLEHYKQEGLISEPISGKYIFND